VTETSELAEALEARGVTAVTTGRSVRAWRTGLPAGSYLALYDGSDVSAAFNAAQDGYNQTGAVPYHLRAPERVAGFFDGLDLVEPGVVPCTRWRPDHTPFGPPADVETYGGAGRKTDG
jgi:S-adenosyl methyltransferase